MTPNERTASTRGTKGARRGQAAAELDFHNASPRPSGCRSTLIWSRVFLKLLLLGVFFKLGGARARLAGPA